MSTTEAEKTLYSIVDHGCYMSSGTATAGLTRDGIRQIQRTLIREAVSLEANIAHLTPAASRVWRQIDVHQPMAVATTEEELEGREGDMGTAIALRVLKAMLEAEIQVEDHDVTDEWLKEDTADTTGQDFMGEEG